MSGFGFGAMLCANGFHCDGPWEGVPGMWVRWCLRCGAVETDETQNMPARWPLNRWDEWRGSMDGRPTMWIKRLLWIPIWRRAGRWLSIRVDLHKFVGKDDDECFHSHPAWAFRLVLRGGYYEEPWHHGRARRWHELVAWRPGDMGFIKPSFAHRVHGLRSGPSYSLWIRGPICADVDLLGEGWAKQKVTAAGMADPYNNKGGIS